MSVSCLVNGVILDVDRVPQMKTVGNYWSRFVTGQMPTSCRWLLLHCDARLTCDVTWKESEVKWNWLYSV